MRIIQLIHELEKYRDSHGDLRVGVDEYNDGFGGYFVPYLEIDQTKSGELFLRIDATREAIE